MQTANEKIPQIPKENGFYFIGIVCCQLMIFDHTWQISGVNLGGRLSMSVFFIFSLFPMALAISLFFMGFKISAFSVMKDFLYGMYLSHCPLIGILSFTNIFAVYPVVGLLFVIGTRFACLYMLEKIVSVHMPKPNTRQSNEQFTMEAYR